MTRYQTPGVYFEWLNTQPAELQIQRTDITGFVGICERGPLHSPQKIESWSQFTSIYGGCIPQAYLAYAVQGFFANGGQTCWVVRSADPNAARCAWANLPDENGAIALTLRGLTPGTWAHRIEAKVLRGGNERFSLTLSLPDGTQEMWRDLELSTTVARLNDEVNGSQLVKAFVTQQAGTEAGKTIHPGRYYFQNGRDGLKTLNAGHLSGNGSPIEHRWGLALLEDINEISILAMPDLMMKDIRQNKTYKPPARCDVVPLENEQPGLAAEQLGAQVYGPAQSIAQAAQATTTMAQTAAPQTSTDDAYTSAMTILPGYGRSQTEIKQKHEEHERIERGEAQAATNFGVLRSPIADTVEVEYPPALSDDAIIDIQTRMVLQCEIQKDRMALLDLPRADLLPTAVMEWLEKGSFNSSYVALYYPWLCVPDPNGSPGELRAIPPSGHMAGVYARVENVIGVHKPPANELIAQAQDVSMPVSDVIHGLLNENNVNLLRAQPGRGLRVAGARTLSGSTEYRYVNVRRLLIMIERSIDTLTQWIPFEPNNRRMWSDTERVVANFLDMIWQRGMLDGASPEDAYFVHCDATTNPPGETDVGRLICLVGLRPPWAVEFVIARIGRTESGSQVLEG